MRLTASTTGIEQVRGELLRIGRLTAERALMLTAEDVEAYVEGQAAVHNRTGALVRSIYLRKAGGAWEVGHDPRAAPQALWVHWGTKPHKIRPKDKSILRWPGGNRWSWAKEVNHPGNKRDPWMERAAALAPRIFAAHVERGLAQG